MYNPKYDFSYSEIQDQVLNFMRELGISPIPKYAQLVLDGRKHRYVVEGDRPTHKNGAYCIYTDGVPAGWVQSWTVSAEPTKWKFDLSGYSDEQRKYFNSKEYQAQAEKRRIEREKRQKEEQAQASGKARKEFEKFEKEPHGHPYLTKKNIYPYNLRLDKSDNSLIVPLTDISGKLATFQRIYPDGSKRFFPGAATKGVFWSIALDTIKNTPRDKILLGEGVATMAKVYELTHYPCVAAMNCGNLLDVAQDLKGKFPKAQIVVMADDDKETEIKRKFNPGRAAADKVVKKGLARAFLSPPFQSPNDGTDWDDFAIKYGNERTAEYLKKIIYEAFLSEQRRKLLSQVEQINAQALRTKEFMPIVWAVEGFIPSGLSVLAGSPKVGKSTLALHLALGIATGDRVLGKINVEQGDVLYLALEDNARRLQDRVRASLPERTPIDRLLLVTEAPQQHVGGLLYIEHWLESVQAPRLVIIDTLQKFRKPLSGKGNIYAEDYAAVSEIKQLADKFNVPFLLIHHLKKTASEDWLNEISGSQGISGAADTILALRRERTNNLGILHRTGRDVEETDFNMERDVFGWILKEEVEQDEKSKLSATQRKIIDYLNENGVKTPQAIANGLGISQNTVKGTLRRLLEKGAVVQNSYGSYSIAGGFVE